MDKEEQKVVTQNKKTKENSTPKTKDKDWETFQKGLKKNISQTSGGSSKVISFKIHMCTLIGESN